MFVRSLIHLPLAWAKHRSAGRRLRKETGLKLCSRCAGTGRFQDTNSPCLGCLGDGFVKA